MAVAKISDDDLLRIIVDLTQRQGAATVREVAEAAGLRSSSTAWHRIHRLQERGLVEAGRRVRATALSVPVSDVTPIEMCFELRVVVDPGAVEPVRVAVLRK